MFILYIWTKDYSGIGFCKISATLHKARWRKWSKLPLYIVYSITKLILLWKYERNLKFSLTKNLLCKFFVMNIIKLIIKP